MQILKKYILINLIKNIIKEDFFMKKKKQTIKCNVSNCKFNNDTEYLCTLDKIDISCTCNKDKCHNKTETICNSFDEKN